MIKNTSPLSMAEAREYLKGSKDEGKEMKGFIKKFTKLNSKKAKDLRKTLEGLKIVKIDGKHISKIIDTLPDNPEDLSKIFVGIGLDDEETKKVLDVVKEVK